MDIRTFVDTTLKPHLLSVPGVADVNVFGGEVRQWQIQVDPRKLVLHGLALQDVLAAARGASVLRGRRVHREREPAAADRDERAGRRASGHRAPAARPEGRRDADARRRGDGGLAPAPSISAAAVNGTPGVFLMVQAQYGATHRRRSRAASSRRSRNCDPLWRASDRRSIHGSFARRISSRRRSATCGPTCSPERCWCWSCWFSSSSMCARRSSAPSAIPVSLLGAVAVLETAGHRAQHHGDRRSGDRDR